VFAVLQWQISGAYLFEWLRPALFALAALLSACVLFDARRRGFRLYAVILWTLGSLLLPHVVLPLYLVTYIFTWPGKREAATSTEIATPPQADDISVKPSSHQPDSQQPAPRTSLWRALVSSVVYAILVLAGGALYFYRDLSSLDAHLVRAANARLRNQHELAASEYRAALRLRDDPHTRKLLAIELSAAHQYEEALTEFRAAERGGEPDDALPFHVAQTLEALRRPEAAANELQKFLQSRLCTQTWPDARCTNAQKRLQEMRSDGSLKN
jgi:hypothetical protein